MIPKTIHFNWIGDRQLTPLNYLCITNAIEMMPGWTIKFWRNFDDCDGEWFRKAKGIASPVSLMNYYRVWRLFQDGGVYIDLDVQMLKPFDITPKCFIGFQREDQMADSLNTAIMGCEKGNPFAGRLLDLYEKTNPDCSAIEQPCIIPTEELLRQGMTGLNTTQEVKGVKIFSRDYFHPIDFSDRSEHLTDNTVCIHHFEGSWE